MLRMFPVAAVTILGGYASFRSRNTAPFA